MSTGSQFSTFPTSISMGLWTVFASEPLSWWKCPWSFESSLQAHHLKMEASSYLFLEYNQVTFQDNCNILEKQKLCYHKFVLVGAHKNIIWFALPLFALAKTFPICYNFNNIPYWNCSCGNGLVFDPSRSTKFRTKILDKKSTNKMMVSVAVAKWRTIFP